MMSVEVKINGRLIARGTARRLNDEPRGLCGYVVNEKDSDDPTHITHVYEDGAIALAKRILNRMEVTDASEHAHGD